jgi:glutamate/tyrosine decarboxylase-like PLP-dependent enzyme
MDELELIRGADERASHYLRGIAQRRVFPDDAAIAGLAAFDEALPEAGLGGESMLALLDAAGSPATVASNGPGYFGFVIGATLPAAAAAERLALAWDQCASSFDNSPAADAIERVAARWLLDILDLPRGSAVGFGTSASACALTCISAARRELLRRKGWNFDAEGLHGAPRIRAIIPATAHITIRKALRILGFGMQHVELAASDAQGRVDPAQLPQLDDMTLLCLQAGEVNTGEFDAFTELLPRARAAGTWVHVDGAFGLWARASSQAQLAADVEGADSWTTDGHKWLNTPYDGAMAICRHAAAFSAALNSDASYASAAPDAQKNLTLEFSRRARGIAVWAALRSLGRAGVRELIDRHCAQARHVATGLRAAGYRIINRVVLNQVLVQADDAVQTRAILQAAQRSGEAWFGASVWAGEPAFRISVCSWRTTEVELDRLIALLTRLKTTAPAD